MAAASCWYRNMGHPFVGLFLSLLAKRMAGFADIAYAMLGA
jgi:hypothetical protein